MTFTQDTHRENVVLRRRLEYAQALALFLWWVLCAVMVGTLAILLAVLFAGTVKAGERVYDAEISDRAILWAVFNPDAQADAVTKGLPPKLKTIWKKADYLADIRLMPGARHSGRPGQRGNVGYYRATLTLRKPYGPLRSLTKGIEAWQLDGADMRFRATCEVDLGTFHGFPLCLVNIRPIHRLANRLVEKGVLAAEQAAIQSFVKEQKERRDRERRERRGW